MTIFYIPIRTQCLNLTTTLPYIYKSKSKKKIVVNGLLKVRIGP